MLKETKKMSTAGRFLVMTGLALSLVGVGSTESAALGLPLQPLNVQLTSAHPHTEWRKDLLSLNGIGRWMGTLIVPAPSLEEIEWTVPRRAELGEIASLWGRRTTDLLQLNPGLTKGATLQPGTKLLVHRRNEQKPTRSIGKPNRGRLVEGIPFPEGPFWELRESRRRVYGTEITIKTTIDALMAYGARFPDAPLVRIGEFSAHRGGRIRPHRSHRSGRDADIGYIIKTDTKSRRFVRATSETLDAEKTWFFVKTLLDSGQVEYIFMNRKVQRLLSKEAAKYLSEEELAKVFEYPRRKDSSRAVIQHWSGHDKHMHVRFKCAAWNGRCR